MVKKNMAETCDFWGSQKTRTGSEAEVLFRSDGPSADLHAAFGSRCPGICIRKGGAHRFLPSLSRIFVPLAVLSLSLLTPWHPRIYGLPAQRVASLTRR